MIHPGQLRDAVDDLGWSLDHLYIEYFALGGNESLATVEGFLTSGEGLSRLEFNKLVSAVNDSYVGRGQDHPVSYSAEPDESG